jgi:hypothetical protein
MRIYHDPPPVFKKYARVAASCTQQIRRIEIPDNKRFLLQAVLFGLTLLPPGVLW